MNVAEYTSLIKTPDTINSIQNETMENIVHEFPYFQSARALMLKSLYNQNSFKYNVSLKITAAHTTDRSVLFDFITSDTFSVKKNKTSEDITLETESKLEQKSNTLEDSILTSINSANQDIKNETELPNEVTTVKINEKVEEAKEEIISTKLEIGKPFSFSTNEKHSFQEWLQLSNLQPIQRKESNIEAENIEEIDSDKKKKNELIDKFIETSPKIPPIKPDAPIPSVFLEPSNADHSSLMTETLARVYLEQKKYQKAIQAYEILILKYPEKSSFFADRILDIKNLQQNNK